ncbi:MAG: ABC transporter substrate-binding protein [Nocardioidaceae bacterium]
MALASMLALAGCGLGSKDDAPGGASAVTVIQGVDPTTMDPLQQRETTTVNVLQHFYDPLLRRDKDDPTTLTGALAESWERTDDLTVRVKLRGGVTFADGAEFSSADVKYTFDYLLGKLPGIKPAIASYQFTTIDTVTAVDELTVDIKTLEPDPLLLDRLTALHIVKDGSVDDDPEALSAEPNGTGPYELVKWDRNNEVVMAARDDYHLGAPAIRDVTFKTVTEASSRLAALSAGDADIITSVPADNVAEVEDSGAATVEAVPSTRIASLWLNAIESGPLQKPEVRLALNHAVDVDEIIEQVMGGHGTRVATFVPPYFTNYDKSIQPLSYDPEKAKDLLQQAGLGSGLEFEVMVPEGRYPFAADIVQALAGFYEDIGVTMKINTVDFGVFAEATQSRKIEDGFFGAWGNSFFNPLDELNVAVVSGDKGFSWYSNKKVDALTAEAGRTLEPETQLDIVTDIQKTILTDPPFVYLFAYEDLYGVSDRLSWKPRSDESIYLYEATVKG